MERPNEFRLVAQRPAKEETAEAGADAVKGAEVSTSGASALDFHYNKFLIQLSVGPRALYLEDYGPDGVKPTLQQDRAKVFRDRESAKTTAKLFHGVAVDQFGRRI